MALSQGSERNCRSGKKTPKEKLLISSLTTSLSGSERAQVFISYRACCQQITQWRITNQQHRSMLHYLSFFGKSHQEIGTEQSSRKTCFENSELVQPGTSWRTFQHPKFPYCTSDRTRVFSKIGHNSRLWTGDGWGSVTIGGSSDGLWVNFLFQFRPL